MSNPCDLVQVFTRVVWKVSNLVYNQRETRDKRLLGRDPDRSQCHRHTSLKLFWSRPMAPWRLAAGCENHGNSRFIPHTSKDWPWDVLTDIANAGHTGNWRRLNSKAKSVGISGILGISTSSPFKLPMILVASIKCF